MANHNKNKRFGGNGNFERFNKVRSTGQDALERDYERKMERARQRPIETDDDFYSTYEDLD